MQDRAEIRNSRTFQRDSALSATALVYFRASFASKYRVNRMKVRVRHVARNEIIANGTCTFAAQTRLDITARIITLGIYAREV